MPDALAVQTLHIDRFREWTVRGSQRRRDAVAVAAGSVSVLAFAPIFAAPVLFVTLAMFVWLIDVSPTPRAAARGGWWFGFGYFFFNLFWLGEAFLVEADKFAVLLPFAVTLLPAGMALFWALAAAAARQFWLSGLARVFVFAIALSAAEWLRGHVLSGLPWNVIGYALTAPLVLMQGAALVGAYGLTAIAIVVFSAPLVILADAKHAPGWARITAVAAISGLPVALLALYGAWRLSETPADVSGVRLRIVQPSVLQTQKWKPEYQAQIFDDHLTLSVTDPSGKRDDMAGITHLIWPEAAMPFLPLEHPEALQAIAAILPDGTTLLTGALRREATDPAGSPLPLDQHRMYNGMLVLNDRAELVARYDKIHLVPFGEYLPVEPLLTALGLKKLTHGQGSFTAGPMPRPILEIAGLPPVVALICYEVLFPGAIVQGGQRPGVIVNVTNDGWFGNSSGPRQHFHQSRVRAVEEGVPLIRAANNGISAVVDRYGRVLHQLGMDERGVIDSPLPGGAAPTMYARYGELFFALILAAYSLLAARLKTREQSLPNFPA
ncbi:MAG: apolipoprotein N-acyltransferase, partial [Hyphomicrobium sp.]|nr:apolipoprotein N-acyltransferase [Hyphomicrobium sp.]